MINERIQNWFDKGQIKNALLGDGEYKIIDHTFSNEHDRILVINQLIYWLENNKVKAKQINLTNIVVSLIKNHFEDALDILFCYHLINKKNPVTIDCEVIKVELKKAIKDNGLKVANNDMLRNKIIRLKTYIPNIY
jgi:hypothetical protein